MPNRDDVLSKVPAVTLGFWIIKILATTLGERMTPKLWRSRLVVVFAG